MNLQHFTPTTLEAMFRDLEDNKTLILASCKESNLVESAEKYRQATNLSCDINRAYENNTGESLILKVYATA